ncbi:MAG: PepSY-like domain-containing protein [Capnocytophaga felis]|nr:PepSY-like domain-containing protein [Capnocytophaga felis]
MRTFKKIGTLLVALFSVTFASAQNDKLISFNQLPAKAQSFIKEHFSEGNIASVWVDADYLLKKEYTVIFNDGSEVEFYSNGDWEEVKSRTGEIPAKIIPAGIARYVQKNFPNTFVKEIKKRRHGYEIELSNGLDLDFNRAGKFLRIDD